MHFLRKNRPFFLALGTLAMVGAFALVMGFPTARSSADSFEGHGGGDDSYSVVHPVVMDTAYTVEYIASIEAVQFVEIKARISGFIERIHIDEGQFVRKGQLLFSIGSQEYEAKVAEAEARTKHALAEARTAEIEYRSVERLRKSDVVSQTDLQLAQAKLDALNAVVDEARSNERNARLDLSYTRVHAPFDGIVGRIPYKTGSFLEGSETVITIADNSSMRTYFNVSENDYLALREMLRSEEAAHISLRLSDHRLYPYQGRIETTDNTFIKGSGTIAFRATFPNPEGMLTNGSTGVVRVRKEVNNAVIIPQRATFEVQNKTFVLALDERNTVQRKEVTIAHRLPHLFILADGELSATDRIIHEGMQRLRDGDTVTPTVASFLREDRTTGIADAAVR